MERSEIARRFRMFHEHTGLTGPKLAEALDLSKQTISAIESDGRSLTRETIQKIADDFHIDPRFFFGQLDNIEDADLSTRGDNPKISRFEALQKDIREIKTKVQPVKQNDPSYKIAESMHGNEPLQDLFELVRFWDATKLRRFTDIAYGFISGVRFEDEKKENQKNTG